MNVIRLANGLRLKRVQTQEWFALDNIHDIVHYCVPTGRGACLKPYNVLNTQLQGLAFIVVRDTATLTGAYISISRGSWPTHLISGALL